MKAQLIPITEDEIPAVAAFLNKELNSRVSAQIWERAIRPAWKTQAPNHGYMLRSDGEVVGAYLAFYSERTIDNQVRQFCNLAAWCVLPAFRAQSFRLLMALLGQQGYVFTDLSPSGSVLALNERLGFRYLDTTTALIPNLPWPSMPGRTSVSSDPAEVERALSGRDLEIYHDHVGAAAARHLVIRHGDRTAYVIFRTVTRKNLPIFASLLHVSDPELLARTIRPLTRHLLLRHGLPLTLLDGALFRVRPRWSRLVNTGRRKMYKSSNVSPELIDNLYSELVCVPW